MTEVWATGISLPGVAVRMAQRAEADGFDGWFVVDSQNLAGDCYVALALAAEATERIKLGTGVTNPYTRHPAVTASAIASVHASSGGRAVLGIGRGDSALAHLGLAPAPVAVFERYLAQVQAYLRGDAVSFAELAVDTVAEVGTLDLADGPASSRLQWLPRDLPKVPVTVAASGPRVIDAAARLADRVTLALGADPERVRVGHRPSSFGPARRSPRCVRQRRVPRRRRRRSGAGQRRHVDLRAVQRHARHHPRTDG